MEKEFEKQKCVVVADRNTGMLEGIRGLLETMFDSVVMVPDEKSLLNAADKLRPDLVLVEVSFAVSGGSGVASLLRRRLPELKFILLGTDKEPEIIDACMASGASGYLLKWGRVRSTLLTHLVRFAIFIRHGPPSKDRVSRCILSHHLPGK